MSLRDQMAEDVCAILNTDELGERARWTNSAGATLDRVVRLIEQPDRQTIRRAHIWTPIATTSVATGNLFQVKRNNTTTTWRVMYTDPAETALQRSYCHLQLDDMVRFSRRRWMVSKKGAATAGPPEHTLGVRGKWFQSSAEIVVREDGKRRKMEGEFYLMLESVADIGSADTVTNTAGESFYIDRLETSLNRVDLPYLILRRADV
jgi:hypothetical protein